MKSGETEVSLSRGVSGREDLRSIREAEENAGPVMATSPRSVVLDKNALATLHPPFGHLQQFQ